MTNREMGFIFALSLLIAFVLSIFSSHAEPGVCAVSRAEAVETMEDTRQQVYKGQEARDFVLNLGEAAVAAGKAPTPDAKANIARLPDFDEVILFFPDGYTSVVSLVLLKDGCVVSVGDFLYDLVSEAMEKMSA